MTGFYVSKGQVIFIILHPSSLGTPWLRARGVVRRALRAILRSRAELPRLGDVTTPDRCRAPASGGFVVVGIEQKHRKRTSRNPPRQRVNTQSIICCCFITISLSMTRVSPSGAPRMGSIRPESAEVMPAFAALGSGP
jgi:hypothetical protein